jgi:hypothetical protein
MNNHLVQILANFDEKGYAPQDRIGPDFLLCRYSRRYWREDISARKSR